MTAVHHRLLDAGKAVPLFHLRRQPPDIIRNRQGGDLDGKVACIVVFRRATGDGAVNVKLYPDSPEGKMTMAKEKYSGKEAYARADYDSAIEEINMALALYPDYVEGYCTRAACHLKKNELDKALADVNKAIELKADYPDSYKERAEIHLKKGQEDKALTDLEKAITLKADYADAYFVRGKLFYKQNNITAAKADLKKAADLGNDAARNFQF